MTHDHLGWAICPHCDGSGRDPADDRPRCSAMAGLFKDKQCLHPAGHNGAHFHTDGRFATGWSSDDDEIERQEKVR